MFRPILLALLTTTAAAQQLTINTATGPVAGTLDHNARAFLGIPYAAPPIGPLRWKPPQPATAWTAPRDATRFGPRCMQTQTGDYAFRDSGPSEDCLTLNVWTPANATPASKLPVMIWIHGGGFTSGGSSEPRQDGAILAATKNVIVVSMNYRLGVFGFFAHTALVAESSQHAAGNYGLLDQSFALAWTAHNIAVFGGDPHNITLFGESAGSMSVSAHMASPLSRSSFSKAIGESGSMFHGPGQYNVAPLAAAAARSEAFAQVIGIRAFPELRSMSAAELEHAAHDFGRFPICVDGLFLTEPIETTYARGAQAHIPLLAGWNADEIRITTIRAKPPVTIASFRKQLESAFGERSADALKVYPAATDAEALRSAGDLASDRFIIYTTWHWIQTQADLNSALAPVFRYRFDLGGPGDKFHPSAAGAFHSDDIEYVFGTLDSRPDAHWRSEDHKLSMQMMAFWTNFARIGDPNGPGLPPWPACTPSTAAVMHLDATSAAKPATDNARYKFLDSFYAAKP